MNNQLSQVANYLAIRGRVVRYRPPTGIPAGERFTQMERLLDAVWQLAPTMGIELGRRPTIIYTGAPISPPSAILGRLTVLLIETLAFFHVTGLSPALSRALLTYTSRTTNEGTPNFNIILDETFSEEETDQVHEG